MPIHDWTRVEAGTFHDFHHCWITEIRRALNRGLLPPNYYAQAEQIAGGLGPDGLTLERPETDQPLTEGTTAIALAEVKPSVEFHLCTEGDRYAAKAKSVTIRHKTGHEVIAVIEIVSPGNKSSRQGMRNFLRKTSELLQAGVHLLVIDLFPPGPRDPQGIHAEIWEAFSNQEFRLPDERRLTLAGYRGAPEPEAYVQPTAVGMSLHTMPLFLEREKYILVPLEPTYQSTWEDVPAVWKEVLTGD